jgi:hypothetical protein
MSENISLIRASGSITDITGDGSTATVTLASAWDNSNLASGQQIRIDGTVNFDGVQEILSVASGYDSFTFSHASSASESVGSARGDYENLTDWLNDRKGNLPGSGFAEVAELYNDYSGGMVLNAQLAFENTDWTTDLNNRIIIRAHSLDEAGSRTTYGNGITLVWNNTTFSTGNHLNGCIQVDTDLHIELDNFEMDGDNTGNTNTKRMVQVYAGAGGGALIMSGVMIHDNAQRDGIDIDCGSNASSGYLVQMTNVIVDTMNDDGISFSNDGGGVFNSTSFCQQVGVYGSVDMGWHSFNGCPINLYNCWSMANTDVDFEGTPGWWGQVINCASDDGTADTIGNKHWLFVDDFEQYTAAGDMDTQKWLEWNDETPGPANFQVIASGGGYVGYIPGNSDQQYATVREECIVSDDYVFKFQFKPDTAAAGYMAGMVRASAPGNETGANNVYLELRINTTSNNLRIRNRYSDPTITTVTVDQASRTMSAGTWYECEMRASGDAVWAKVSGPDIADAVMSGSLNGQNTTGPPGLKKAYTVQDYEYTNIEVHSLDDEMPLASTTAGANFTDAAGDDFSLDDDAPIRAGGSENDVTATHDIRGVIYQNAMPPIGPFCSGEPPTPPAPEPPDPPPLGSYTAFTYEEEWYYDDTNTDYYTANFYASGYNPSAWAGDGSDSGVFGAGTLDNLPAGVTVNTAITIDSGDRRSHYFLRDFEIVDADAISKITLNAIRDDGVVIWVNGTEVARVNYTGTPAHAGAATAAQGEGVPFTWELTGSDLDAFQTGSNRIAAMLFQNSPTSSDAGFDAEMVVEVSGTLDYHCVPCPIAVVEDEATIHFEFDEDSDAYVEYGPTEGQVSKYSTSAVTNRQMFQIAIPNGEADFSAGSRVYYRVRMRRTGGGPYGYGKLSNFRLARPSSDTGPWWFAAGADSRSSGGATTHADFKSDFWPSVGTSGEEFLLFGGDWLNTMGAGAWRAIRGSGEGMGREDQKCGSLPVFQNIGNHEFDGTASNRLSRTERYPLGAFLNLTGQQTSGVDSDWHQRYYYWTWGEALFIGFCDDDAIYSTGGHNLWEDERVWISGILEANKYMKYKFLYSHTPLDESDPSHSDTIADHANSQAYMLSLIEQYGVTAYFHGHYHGWRAEKTTHNCWYLCTNFGAPTHFTQGTWYGEKKYMRLRVGWNESGVSGPEADPDKISVYLTDPANSDSVDRVWIINADDNPAPVEPTVESGVASMANVTAGQGGALGIHGYGTGTSMYIRID